MLSNPGQLYAVEHVRSALAESEVKLADQARWLDEPYIAFERDRKVAKRLKALCRSLASPNPEGHFPDKRRILAFCGESGAGKTRTLVEHVKKHPAMQPYVDENGIRRDPVLWFRPPSPCTPKLLAFTGLRQLKFPVRESARENEMWQLFRDQLKIHRIRFVVIDEAQDAIEPANRLEKLKLASSMKNLVQMEDWALRLIVAGSSPLQEFLSRPHLLNRRKIVVFKNLDGDDGLATVSGIVSTIVTKHAGLKLGEDLPNDLSARLCHAANASVGTVIEMVRGAVENSMAEAKTSVTREDFAEAYEGVYGCAEASNVFLAELWQTIDPVVKDGEVEVNPYKKPSKGKELKVSGDVR